MKCYGCKKDWGVFIPSVSLVIEGGEAHMPRKLMGVCNDPGCPQRYWWFDKSKRLTRRNSGPSDWRDIKHQT